MQIKFIQKHTWFKLRAKNFWQNTLFESKHMNENPRPDGL